MTPSLVYRSPWLYELLIRALYGRHYAARYRMIADLIPRGSSVVELGCGPATLFDRYLRDREVDYTGLDVNRGFLERLERRGGRARSWDLHRDDPLPRADVVMMQASLYHFLPDAAPVVERMLAAADRLVIIAEPIRNLADSRLPLLAAAARRQTDPGLGEHALRFTEPTLDRFLASFTPRPSRSFLIPGGREKVYLFDVGPTRDRGASEPPAPAGPDRDPVP